MGQSAIKDRVWYDLLTQIGEGSVIPIVGPHAARLDIRGERLLLPEHLARHVAHELGVAGFPPDVRGDDALHRLALASTKGRGEIDEELSYYLRGDALAVPESLRKLAAIRRFQLFLSTTPDSLLRRAIDAERFGGKETTRSLSYAPSTRCDLPGPADQLTAPVVFHIFGKAAGSPEYALTQRDTVEYLHDLQSQTHRPKHLFDALRDRHLLLLGTGMGGWLARWFLRVVRDRRLDEVPCKTQFIADPAVTSDPGLVEFLERMTSNAKVLPVHDTEAFIAELHARVLERFGSTEAPRVVFGDAMRRGAVFISYCRDDIAHAARLCRALEDAQIDVWMDKQELRAGSAWESQIETNIAHCSVFVPLLSPRTASEARRESFFRKEWRLAEERSKRVSSSTTFIVPVLLGGDASTYEASDPPPEFARRNWVFSEDGSPTPDLLKVLKDTQRTYQRIHRQEGQA
jgi:hypothetical protein